MEKIDYLGELKEIDVLILKNMFSERRGLGAKSCSGAAQGSGAKAESRFGAGRGKMRSMLSPLQLRIFRYLRENRKRAVTQAELEKNLKVSRATISGTLLAMEKNGAIERAVSGQDARVKIVKLTEKSLNAYREMQKKTDELNRRIAQGISEEELEKFLEVLGRMKENLKAGE